METNQPLGNLPKTTEQPDFIQAVTSPTVEQALTERNRVVSEWIDDVNKADAALGGGTASYGQRLVDRWDTKHTWGSGPVKPEDFKDFNAIYGDSPLVDDKRVAASIAFGHTKDGNPFLSLYTVTIHSEHGEPKSEVSDLIPVTDQNKDQVDQIVKFRVDYVNKFNQNRLKSVQLTSLPKAEIRPPQV